MKFGKFNLEIVRESSFRLDGGAMYGVVPKTLWSRGVDVDEANRVLLNCNLLLIETPEGRVLVETGMGNRWSDIEKDRYQLESLVSPDSMLKQLNLTNDEVDAVLISHLHFDHAGGATIEKDGVLVPAFPKAKYYVQKGEWEFAHNCNARARGSYRFEDFEPLLEHGVLEFVDGDKEILPGVWLKVTGGHTSHHQVIYFESEGQSGVYFADILPTAGHVQPPWVMGYDHYPLTSCDIKSEWLAKAVEEKWLVVFDHEPGIPWGHVSINEKKKFQFEPLAAETLQSCRRAEATG